MRSQLTVGVAAFVADGLFGAGGRAAGVGGLAAELIPLFVYLKACRIQLVSEILQRLSAALAAEPMIVSSLQWSMSLIFIIPMI